MTRPYRTWSEAELAQIAAWRAGPEPLSYVEIGRRLGGRSGQAVRLKLYEQESAVRRLASRGKGFRRAAPERDGPPIAPARDARLVKLCRAGGGFTALSTQVLGRQTLLCLPRIGAGGVPRPAGWKDGVTRDAAHMAALKAVWKRQDGEG